jgi:hypothetical protein
MTGNVNAGARRALTEVGKPFADQGQREGAAAKVDVRSHSFDWWDLLLFAMPIATIVFAMYWEAEG